MSELTRLELVRARRLMWVWTANALVFLVLAGVLYHGGVAGRLMWAGVILSFHRAGYWYGWFVCGRAAESAGPCGHTTAALLPLGTPDLVCILPVGHRGRTHSDGTTSWTPRHYIGKAWR